MAHQYPGPPPEQPPGQPGQNPYAVVFFFFCLLGLLFLLMKERTTTGFVQVTVNSQGRHHSTMIPVQSREQVMFVLNQVHYARSLSV